MAESFDCPRNDFTPGWTNHLRDVSVREEYASLLPSYDLHRMKIRSERSTSPFCRGIHRLVKSRRILCLSRILGNSPIRAEALSVRILLASPSSLVFAQNILKVRGHLASKLGSKPINISSSHHGTEQHTLFLPGLDNLGTRKISEDTLNSPDVAPFVNLDATGHPVTIETAKKAKDGRSVSNDWRRPLLVATLRFAITGWISLTIA